MTGVSLRAYQEDAIERCRREVARGRRRVLLVAPTGAGKTVIAAAIVAGVETKGKKAVSLAHRRELIQQAANKLSDVAGIDAGVVMPGFLGRPERSVQVASVWSLEGRAIRSAKMEMPPADVVVVDEAHHARAATYGRLLEQYPEAVILGLTATPCRRDGRGLGNCFDVLVECPSVAELTRLGHLVPTIVYAPPAPDLTGIQLRHGDYVEDQLAERMDKPQLVGNVVEHWLRLGDRRRTVVFAASVGHSVHLRDEFRRAGVMAEHVDGKTPIDERDAILAGIESGKVEVICNYGVLTEGWDQPSVSCAVLARPTKGLGLYRQMAGRVLRPCPEVGKKDALILDHGGLTYAHGLLQDDIAWTLREDKRAENAAHASRVSSGGPKFLDCPACQALRMPGQPCIACGWKPTPRGAEVEVVDRDLARVEGRTAKKHVATMAEKRQFQAELVWIARERNYQDGWVSRKYREKFGIWPVGEVAMAEPSPATRSWVKSRQIAYAKAMQKQGAPA